MELSPKAIRFIIEALEYRMKTYQELLLTDGLDENQISDITNDTMYLDSLCQELRKTRAISASPLS